MQVTGALPRGLYSKEETSHHFQALSAPSWPAVQSIYRITELRMFKSEHNSTIYLEGKEVGGRIHREMSMDS